MSSWTIAEALMQYRRLQAVSESPQTDIEWLLLEVLQAPRTVFFTDPDVQLSEAQQAQFEHFLSQRLSGKPVAHILGHWDFWTLTLEVNDSTLVPRPDTEILVEQALELLADGPYRVADLGTGTGAIALALASERPQWSVYACELSTAAAELAERNRRRLSLTNVEVFEGSWGEPLLARQINQLDMLVSNPPYIDAADPHLNCGDLRFEPRAALVADQQGLAAIATIAEQGHKLLKAGGWLLLEHGYNQGASVRELMAAYGYEVLQTHADYGGNERVTAGRLP